MEFPCPICRGPNPAGGGICNACWDLKTKASESSRRLKGVLKMIGEEMPNRASDAGPNASGPNAEDWRDEAQEALEDLEAALREDSGKEALGKLRDALKALGQAMDLAQKDGEAEEPEDTSGEGEDD